MLNDLFVFLAWLHLFIADLYVDKGMALQIHRDPALFPLPSIAPCHSHAAIRECEGPEPLAHIPSHLLLPLHFFFFLSPELPRYICGPIAVIGLMPC